MEEKLYPVQALGSNITAILSHVHSVGIRDLVKKGLDNRIKYIDQGSHITSVAEIKPYLLRKNEAFVELSAAYCQFLWLICDATYKLVDYLTIVSSSLEFGITPEQFEIAARQISQMPTDEIKRKSGEFLLDSEIEQYREYLKRVEGLVLKFPESIIDELSLAYSLKCREREIDFEKIDRLNLQGKYEALSNSVYCNGIAFILLHEATHYSLGHVWSNPDDGDEEAADFDAYWSLYNEVDKAHKFTAGCGILSALFSLLYLNEDLESDDEHPREDMRIFAFYEVVKDDNPKFLTLLIRSFEIWGWHKKDYPMHLPPTPESINVIKAYISEHYPL